MITNLLWLLLMLSVIGALAYGWGRQYRLSKPPALAVSAEQLSYLQLQPKISWCKYLENIGDLGERLATQNAMMVSVLSVSLSVLRQKFTVEELTFARYQNTISQTQQVMVDNLSKMIPLLEALDATQLEPATNRQSLIDRVEHLLSLNQTLLDKLNELVANLSDIKNLAGPDQKTAEFLRDNLQVMTERAKRY